MFMYCSALFFFLFILFYNGGPLLLCSCFILVKMEWARWRSARGIHGKRKRFQVRIYQCKQSFEFFESTALKKPITSPIDFKISKFLNHYREIIHFREIQFSVNLVRGETNYFTQSFTCMKIGESQYVWMWAKGSTWWKLKSTCRWLGRFHRRQF